MTDTPEKRPLPTTETFQGYLIKYALASSAGIQLRQFERCSTGDNYVRPSGDRSSWGNLYVLGRDVFLDYGSALAAVLAARTKKLASLKKQMAKLEAKTFHEPTELS